MGVPPWQSVKTLYPKTGTMRYPLAHKSAV